MILITVYPVYVMINGKKFVQTYSTNSINSQNSTKGQKLTISQKSQNDSSLQNSTNVKYAPNLQKYAIFRIIGKLVTVCNILRLWPQM